MYECASKVNDDIAIKEENHIPRILNWRIVSVRRKYEMFMSSMFCEVPIYLIIF